MVVVVVIVVVDFADDVDVVAVFVFDDVVVIVLVILEFIFVVVTVATVDLASDVAVVVVNLAMFVLLDFAIVGLSDTAVDAITVSIAIVAVKVSVSPPAFLVVEVVVTMAPSKTITTQKYSNHLPTRHMLTLNSADRWN